MELIVDKKKFRTFIVEYKSGDLEARNRMIQEYMGVAREVAEEYYGFGLEDEDVIQIAYEGLVQIVDIFLKSTSVPKINWFLNYIRNYVNQSVGMYRRGNRPLLKGDGFELRILKIQRDLTIKLGRNPYIDEICERGLLDESTVCKFIEADAKENVSLDAMSPTEAMYIPGSIVDVEADMIRKFNTDMLSRELEGWDCISSYYVLDQKCRELKKKLIKENYCAEDSSTYSAVEGEKRFINRRKRDRAQNKYRY